MSGSIITVENLSKRYQLGQIGATTLRESAERLMHRLRRRKTLDLRPQTADQKSLKSNVYGLESDPQDFWALKNVSFEVSQGEVLGIIGRNGAGKSTLLKILSRITEPTSGRAIIRGRVASLLEVGTGFHPELSGRENIFLNGAILGMRHAEIGRKFDEIVAFSGVEKFIDTPVKHYSSGMYVRLAFSVAAHLEPDILIVDEVLSVGDLAFRNKCFDYMKRLLNSGVTILIVSHDMAQISTLCKQVVWLNNGHIQAAGETSSVVSGYTNHILDYALQLEFSKGKQESAGELELASVRTVSADGTPKTRFAMGEDIFFELDVIVHKPVAEPCFCLAISTCDGVKLFLHNSRVQGVFPLLVKENGTVRFRLPKPPFLASQYTVFVGVSEKASSNTTYLCWPNCHAFQILAPSQSFSNMSIYSGSLNGVGMFKWDGEWQFPWKTTQATLTQ